MWLQLEEILREYVFGGGAPPPGLLFPSPRTGTMVKDTRRLLDALAKRIGMEEGKMRTKVFRHTYTAARLQTTDDGAPVKAYTVAKELGHRSTRMIERVYGHRGVVRHRKEVVEYRVENYREKLGEQLTVLEVA